MLIPENGKWRCNDGPLCDTKEAALKTAVAQPAIKDSEPPVIMMDCVEVMSEIPG